jgi:hypothetical protein
MTSPLRGCMIVSVGEKSTMDAHKVPGDRMGRKKNYRIGVRGHLSPAMMEWFGDITVENCPDGSAWLTLRQVDQARLYGVLNQLRDWSIALLEIQPLPSDSETGRLGI